MISPDEKVIQIEGSYLFRLRVAWRTNMGKTHSEKSFGRPIKNPLNLLEVLGRFLLVSGINIPKKTILARAVGATRENVFQGEFYPLSDFS